MAMAGDFPLNNNNSLGYVSPNTGTAFGSLGYYQPQPCPTCHRCPTCGSYGPNRWPNTWTAPKITWGGAGTGTGTLDAGGTSTTTIWHNPNATATATTVPDTFVHRQSNETLMQQLKAQATATNCAEDCSHDD